MVQKIILILLSAIGTICLGLLTNYISDKIKNHSVRESDFEFKLKFKSLSIKFKYHKKH